MPAVYINLYQKLCINLYSNNMSIYNIILEMYLSSRNMCMNIVVMLYGAVICISNGTFICIKNLYQVVSIYLYCCNLGGDNKKWTTLTRDGSRRRRSRDSPYRRARSLFRTNYVHVTRVLY